VGVGVATSRARPGRRPLPVLMRVTARRSRRGLVEGVRRVGRATPKSRPGLGSRGRSARPLEAAREGGRRSKSVRLSYGVAGAWAARGWGGREGAQRPTVRGNSARAPSSQAPSRARELRRWRPSAQAPRRGRRVSALGRREWEDRPPWWRHGGRGGARCSGNDVPPLEPTVIARPSPSQPAGSPRTPSSPRPASAATHLGGAPTMRGHQRGGRIRSSSRSTGTLPTSYGKGTTRSSVNGHSRVPS